MTDGSRIAVVGGDIEDEIDTPLLAPRLRSAGFDVDLVSWRDPDVRWGDHDFALLRSCWDYVDDVGAFLTWAAEVARQTHLLNPFELVVWNTNKRYLIELAEAGIGVVPNTLFEPGQPFHWPEAFESASEVVVKPCVGAGSRMVARYSRAEEHRATRHVADLHSRGQSALVQPFISSVDTEGELGVYVFAGKTTHLISKSSSLVTGADPRDDFSLVSTQRVTSLAHEQEAATFAEDLVLKLPGGPPLYARVDLLRSSRGPMLLELELIEPVLFLDRSPTAADRVASAIIAHLATINPIEPN